MGWILRGLLERFMGVDEGRVRGIWVRGRELFHAYMARGVPYIFRDVQGGTQRLEVNE